MILVWKDDKGERKRNKVINGAKSGNGRWKIGGNKGESEIAWAIDFKRAR